MTDFDTLKNAQADLAIAPLNLTVLLAPYSATPATSLEGSGGSLDVPAEYQSVGHFEKAAGLSLGIDMTSNDIEAYGESDPIRTIISRRKTTFTFNMYQSQKNVLELIWTADSSDFTQSSSGGVVLEAPATPKNRYYRAALVGRDDRDEGEVFVYWLMPKVKLESVDNQTLNDDNVLMYAPTLVAFKDDVLGYSVAQGFCGSGWTAIAASAGFTGASGGGTGGSGSSGASGGTGGTGSSGASGS